MQQQQRSAFYILEVAMGGGYITLDGKTTNNISFARHFENMEEIEAFKKESPYALYPKYVQAAYTIIQM
ncbi:MAG TPA: hypothetical protein VK190_02665 [Pseudoneobacillus sp.]|nr:hypothetical protein [Pseudoneobacillus sp.]